MSDAASHNLKVSREGIVLIKSFEGFRPRAIQRAEGGWIIGYGHTLSAREGATVSEADAELLLRYDLLPVEASVNDTVPSGLNQHQFDALVSFAFSVGVDRFAGSDVRQRLAAGAPGEAADAIMGWPEPALPDTALRRRAAERALFVANPGAPVALSDLLSAPLPPPPVPAPVEKPEIETVAEAESVTPEPVVAGPQREEVVTPIDPRGAAVAALLGEPPARLIQDEAEQAPIIPSFAAPTIVATPAPSNDNPPVENVVESEPAAEDTVPTEPVVEATVAEAEPLAEASPPEESQNASLLPVETIQDPASTSEHADETPVVDAISNEEPGADEIVAEEPTDSSDDEASTQAAAWSASRYAPYSLSMVGPLPYLQPATTHAGTDTPAIDHSVVEVSPVEAEEAPGDAETDSVEEQAEESTEVVAAETSAESAEEVVAPEIESTPAEIEEPAPGEPALVAEPEAPTPVEPMVYVAPVEAAPVAELVLTPLEDSPEPALARPLWTAEERAESDGSETNLFGEDLTLTLGGSVMRHEIEMEAPARFDWKETAPFIFMGGVGLVSFGASMAAFRRAAEQSGGSELTIIGWVLALIGLGCVGVSSINLYRKFGLPGGD